MTNKLTSGNEFPNLSLKVSDGSTLSLPNDLQTPLTIVLFYRGHW
jgi:peroxiredoxin